MSLLETLLQSMTSASSLDTMSKRTGGNNDQMATLITAALPILLKALTANASTQSGAASLQKALSQHQENSLKLPTRQTGQRFYSISWEATLPRL